jgi:hypothetical protein
VAARWGRTRTLEEPSRRRGLPDWGAFGTVSQWIVRVGWAEIGREVGRVERPSGAAGARVPEQAVCWLVGLSCGLGYAGAGSGGT